MKTAKTLKMVVIPVAMVLITTVSTSAFSQRLDRVDTFSKEISTQNGPETAIQIISNLFGYPLIGPSGLGVNFIDDSISATAGASSYNYVTWQFWQYGSTQTATMNYSFAAIYELNGDAGSTADINLSYSYDNNHLNTVIDGRSESKSSASLFYTIAPQSVADNFSNNAGMVLLNFLSHSNGSLISAPKFQDYDSFSMSYDKNYPFAAFTWGNETEKGNIPMGSMEVGDKLYLIGFLSATTEGQVYGPATVIATMVTTLKTDFNITDTTPPNPVVPEPGCLLLFGSGLAACWTIKSIKCK